MQWTQTAQGMVYMYLLNQFLSIVSQSLTPPTSTSGGGYRFLYNFLTIAAADFKSFIKDPSKVTTIETGTTNRILPSGAVEASSATMSTTEVTKS